MAQFVMKNQQIMKILSPLQNFSILIEPLVNMAQCAFRLQMQETASRYPHLLQEYAE
jgi:hypothetical protein